MKRKNLAVQLFFSYTGTRVLWKLTLTSTYYIFCLLFCFLFFIIYFVGTSKPAAYAIKGDIDIAGKLSVINMKEDTRLPVGATGPRGAGGVSPIKARSIATEEMKIKRKKE